MKKLLGFLLFLGLATNVYSQASCGVIEQSQAFEFKIGPFVDSGDFVTPETGLTISQGDVLLAKNGGDWTQKNDTNACVHESAGMYRCAGNATDSDTAGNLLLKVDEGGALHVKCSYTVLPLEPFAWLVGGSTLTQIDVEDAVGDELDERRLNQLVAADSDLDGAAPPTVGSFFHELMTTSAGSFTFSQTTDSMEGLDADTSAILDDTGTSGVVIVNDGITAAKIAAAAITASEAPNLNAFVRTIPLNTTFTDYPIFMRNASNPTLGITGQTVTCDRSIAGAAFGDAAGGASATEVGAGLYRLTLTSADMNGNWVFLVCSGTGGTGTSQVYSQIIFTQH